MIAVKLAGHVARMVWDRNSYKVLVMKPESPGRRGEVNIENWS